MRPVSGRHAMRTNLPCPADAADESISTPLPRAMAALRDLVFTTYGSRADDVVQAHRNPWLAA
jgi:hypothetical protein